MSDHQQSNGSQLSGLFLFLSGMCMGVADLIPGISGGTIAFIMGFYSNLMSCLKSFNLKAFKLLFNGQFLAFSRHIQWKFLLTLGGGMVTSILLFSHFIHVILGQPVLRTFFYSFFLGLVLASFLVCFRKIRFNSLSPVLGIVSSAFVAYLLTTAAWIPQFQPSHLQETHFFDVWVLICGSIAVCALLLPGISGSYLMSLVGLYPSLIASTAQLGYGLKSLTFPADAIILLSNFFVGICLGALLFAKLLSWLLSTFPNLSMAILSGFMIGSLRSIWPFSDASNSVLLSDSPSVNAVALLFVVIGVGVVLGIDFFSKYRPTTHSSFLR